MLNFLLLYPDIYICICVLLLLIFCVILNEKLLKLKYKLNTLKFANFFCCLILFYAIFILWETIWYEGYVLNFQFFINKFSFFNKFLVLILSFFCLISSLKYLIFEKIKYFEYYILIMLSILGIWTLICSYDLLTMYLSIEIQSLCFYIITSLKMYSNFSVESAIKYFVLGALSSGLLLFGCSFIYGFTGTTNFLDFYILFFFYTLNSYNYFLYFGNLIGLFLLLSALSFKLGIVPFHVWVADIYEGAPTIVTIFFATVPQISIFSLIIKINLIFFLAFKKYLTYFFLLLGFLSIMVGTLNAIKQTKIKRLITYSGINNIGYIFSLLFSLNCSNYSSSFFYLIIYLLSSFSLWFFVIILRNYSNFQEIKNIKDLFFLKNNNKFLLIIITIFLFSSMGIPPLIGFFIKLLFFSEFITNGLYFYSLFLIAISSIAIYYYLKLFQKIYSFSTKKEIFLIPITKKQSWLLMFLFLLNILFFLWPNYLYLLINNIFLNVFFYG